MRPRRDLARLGPAGKFHRCGLLESHNIRKSFVNLSRLMMRLFLICFFNLIRFCAALGDFFKPTSCCQTGSIYVIFLFCCSGSDLT